MEKIDQAEAITDEVSDYSIEINAPITATQPSEKPSEEYEKEKEFRKAVFRSQSFWGTMVWVDENFISTPFKPRHYYLLAALMDREAQHNIGVKLDEMTTGRLTDLLRKDFYEDESPVISNRQAENDLKFLRSDKMGEPYIRNDKGGLDLSRFSAAPSSKLRGLTLESHGAFPSQG